MRQEHMGSLVLELTSENKETFMKYIVFSGVLTVMSFSSIAAVKDEDALKYVPGGSVVENKKDEVKVRSPQGGIVELEFKRNGKLDEASGDMIELDSFVPGENYLPLDRIAASLKEEGHQLRGDWSYDKGFMKDWRYEVDTIQNNERFELVVDAKTAKILDKRIDD